MIAGEIAALAERLHGALGRLEATTVREAAFFLGLTAQDLSGRGRRRAEAALLLAGFEPTETGRWKRSDAGDLPPLGLRRHGGTEEDAHAAAD